jgi:glycerol uptake facilitator-like aquaporin
MKFIETVPEYLGTFALIFSILATGNYLVIGLTLAAVIFLVGDLSGANVNPVVSLVMYLNNQMSGQKCLEYLVVQVLGGLSALYTYKYIVKHVRS